MNGGVKPTIEDEIKIIPLRPKEYTEEEKEAIKLHLKEKYPQIVDHILVMALESVNYAEDRAMQILQIVKEEEEQQKLQKTPKLAHTTTLEYKQEELDGLGNISGRVSRHSHRDQTDAATDKLCKDFKSLMGRIQTNGPNASLAKEADYVTWNGANPDFCQGQRNLANGADSTMRTERAYKAYGHNADLCKGPQSSLAKGSIYTQQNPANANKSIDIICN
ncbi:uncharacterized protein LOC119615574 [Lucilia sericata]|uniref:uncharacterized protein LOC119615574 n=1 Tax=Lucilia sericata TaxID=13632 RepID=UPI0018A843B0|nr:uncharacterized protein LOC119615574 [Lucilia sericata]